MASGFPGGYIYSAALRIGKSGRRIEHMNNSIHAGMDQAGELEVALSGKTYGVGASVTWQDAAIHTL
jgi:hypothetical protein